jgi:spore maturation protein CgeB
MKIICEFGESAPRYVRNGWRRVFEALGHTFVFWDRNSKSAHDLFYENPDVDIFIGTTYNCDTALIKCLTKKPDIKVAMFCSAWGQLTGSLNRKEFPIDYVNEQEITNIELLKQKTGKPDFVFIHITDGYLDDCIGGWRDIGVKPVGILNACDTFIYNNSKHRDELVADIGFVGGRWGYKSKTIDKYLTRLCDEFPVKYDIKIFGNSHWPVSQYLGFLPEGQDADVFVSSRICPNISESHSYIYPDIVERCFKVPGARGFLISDKVDLSEVFEEGTVPQFFDYDSFIYVIEKYLKDPAARFELAKKQREQVLTKHTYFDRVAKMFLEFDMKKDYELCLNCKEVLLRGA